jgi:hypothetical protein
LLISVSLFGQWPFISIGTLASRAVGTHDGLRSYGGYLWQMAIVGPFAPQSPIQIAADRIFREFLEPDGPDIVIAGAESAMLPGGVGWRYLQLRLERSGIHGAFVAPHRLQFNMQQRRLTLVTEFPSDAADQFDRGYGVKLYDLRDEEHAKPCWQSGVIDDCIATK